MTFLLSANTDVPNAGRGLVRLEYRQNDWDPAFKDYLVKLDNTKPVIACGDLNVAHLDIGTLIPASLLSSYFFLMLLVLCTVSIHINVNSDLEEESSAMN